MKGLIAMRIVNFVHFSVPWRNAGSETMLDNLSQELTQHGHEVITVATNVTHATSHWQMNGYRGIKARTHMDAEKIIRGLKPDIVVTHHDNATRAIRLCREIGAKSVFLAHNNMAPTVKTLEHKPDLVVCNTEWIRKDLNYAGKTVVIHPPVWPEKHATTPGNSVTLVNMNKNKGSYIFYNLAARFPRTKFLAVEGGHGHQIIQRKHNVTHQKQTQNMRDDVWAKTRILIMPSIYESYGMVAVEAMASGIPVVANPTPGLEEALGDAGIFANRSDTREWNRTLKLLINDNDAWNQASEKALERSAELDPTLDLKKWVEALESL